MLKRFEDIGYDVIAYRGYFGHWCVSNHFTFWNSGRPGLSWLSLIRSFAPTQWWSSETR
jgi:hypothetical protein